MQNGRGQYSRDEEDLPRIDFSKCLILDTG